MGLFGFGKKADKPYRVMHYEGIDSVASNMPCTFLIKNDVIKALKKDEQELLHYRYVLEKSIKEIATELNTTENNVYQRLFRLKVKVKMQIQKQLYN